ncbi:MAG: hypothetical protein HY300_17815 [Verrucomicrobia bacterium]|nr:hypothetical protein [Verrucomicrobiota bacterium]
MPPPVIHRRCALFVVLLFLWAGAAASSFAYEVSYAKTGYQVTSGMDYAIHYELKQLIARHEQLFKRKAPTEFKITYNIFPTYEEYQKYSAANDHPVSRQLLGYTHSSATVRRDTGEIVRVQAEIVSWKQEQPAVHLATVLHETTHAVTHAFLLHVPLWMNEGSADWLGRPQWADGTAQKTDRARRWQTLKILLDNNKLPPLRVFLTAESYEEWDKLLGDRGMGYVIGYSLFDYFMSQPNAQDFLAALLKSSDVERGVKPGAAFTAQLDKLWRGGLPEFERGWHNWIRRKAELEKAPPEKKKK